MKSTFLFLAVISALPAAEFIPEPGKFPPPGAGHYLAGELVSVDHVNRRGGLRLDGDGVEDRYWFAPTHEFALLPYATVRYHGGTAELAQVPLGTHLNGTFFLAPEDDLTFPRHAPGKGPRFYDPHKFAVLLEDDSSFYQRRGQAWKIDEVYPGKFLTATLTGPELPGGLKGQRKFTIDASTRVWKGNGFASPEDIQPGQSVQMNFAWLPQWELGQFHAADVWLDEESLSHAAERQSQLHIRHTSFRWLPAQIDHIEHLPGGRGIVTLTAFSGQAPQLYDTLRNAVAKNNNGRLAVAEPTLRTWWHNHDSKGGKLMDLKEIPNPPPGHSGLQVRMEVNEVLEGYRPNRIVRLHMPGFPQGMLPPEERMRKVEERAVSFEKAAKK